MTFRSLSVLLFCFPLSLLAAPNALVQTSTQVLVGFVQKNDVLAEAKARVLYRKACANWKTEVMTSTLENLDISEISCKPMELPPSTNGNQGAGFTVKFVGEFKATMKKQKGEPVSFSETIYGTSRYTPSFMWSPIPTTGNPDAPDYSAAYDLTKKCNERVHFLKQTLKSKLVYAGCGQISFARTVFGKNDDYYFRTQAGKDVYGEVEHHWATPLQVVLAPGSHEDEIQSTEGKWEGQEFEVNISYPAPEPWRNMGPAWTASVQSQLSACALSEQKFKEFFGADLLLVTCERAASAFSYHHIRDVSFARALIDDGVGVSTGGIARAFYLVKKSPGLVPSVFP